VCCGWRRACRPKKKGLLTFMVELNFWAQGDKMGTHPGWSHTARPHAKCEPTHKVARSKASVTKAGIEARRAFPHVGKRIGFLGDGASNKQQP